LELAETRPSLIAYYERRAGEYEQIYAKPERQKDLELLRKSIPERLRGRRVLEVACGTGYWTALVAPLAASVVAVDMAEEPMAIARGKGLKVRFEKADAYRLPETLGRFDAALAVFWWSHVPRRRIAEFLASLHARLEPGARVLLMDNRYVEGSSTPVAEVDADGDSYQMRGADRVLKNFPSEAELRGLLPSPCLNLLEYYWVAEYQLP
jgi:SAM-dependent methyltransferase